MLHPSYTDLMNVVNHGSEDGTVDNGEEPIINSRYSIVIAASKRARQLIEERGEEESGNCFKPLSIAVDELDKGIVKIIGEDDLAEEDIDLNPETNMEGQAEADGNSSDDENAGEQEILDTDEEIAVSEEE